MVKYIGDITHSSFHYFEFAFMCTIYQNLLQMFYRANVFLLQQLPDIKWSK